VSAVTQVLADLGLRVTAEAPRRAA
jgi:hypothetical protein